MIYCFRHIDLNMGFVKFVNILRFFNNASLIGKILMVKLCENKKRTNISAYYNANGNT